MAVDAVDQRRRKVSWCKSREVTWPCALCLLAAASSLCVTPTVAFHVATFQSAPNGRTLRSVLPSSKGKYAVSSIQTTAAETMARTHYEHFRDDRRPLFSYVNIASAAAAAEEGTSPSPVRTAAASPTTSPSVRWDDLLQATQPLDCANTDDECLYRQLTFPEEDEANSGLALTSLDDVVTQRDVLILGTSLATLSLGVVFWFMLWAGPGAWRYAVAGGICAALSHVIPVPIDTIKTRKQIDPAFSRLNFWQTFRLIVQNEGTKGLWVGLGPTAVGYALEGAIKFGVYEVLKPIVARAVAQIASVSSYLAFVNTKVVAFAISAGLAGVAASFVLCPMEALRIRMVANPDVSQSGWLVNGCQIIRSEGAMALSKGITPMLLKQVPYTVTKNVSFDFITRYAYSALLWRGSVIGPLIKLAVPLSAAAVASILSCVTSQPGDMLLTLSSARSGDRRRTRDIVRDIWLSDRGAAGFFVGMKTRFLHMGVIVTIQLFIYDFVKRLCGIAATGTA